MNELQGCPSGNRSRIDDIIDGLSQRQAQPMILQWTAKAHDSWTYEEVGRQVQRLAGGLQRHIHRGEAVVLFGTDSPAWIIAALAIIRAGGAVTPVDLQLPDDTLAHVLQDCGASWVFTTSGHQARVRELAPGVNIRLLDVADPEQNGWQSLAEEQQELPINCADDTAALFYTSGTTGPPKGVPLTHENIAFQLEAVSTSGITRAADRVLLPLPLHHVYPFVIGMLAPVRLGLSLVIPYALTGPQLLRAVHDGQVSVIIGVPRLYAALFNGIQTRASRSGRLASALFRILLKLSRLARMRYGVSLGKALLYPLHRQFGRHLRVLACGGAALDPELAWNLEALGWQVAVGYGLTETAPLLTIDPPGQIRPGTVGKPVSGVSLRIAPSAAAQAVTAQREGEILARGPSVFAGYLHQLEKTREAFTDDGWFRTGDLGWLDEDGYLHLSGRASTLIVTAGGENIQPDDLEERYATHAAIEEIGILQYEGKLVALIVPRKDSVNDIPSRIREALSEVARKLPSYQQLVDFSLSSKPLPRTRLGKIKRHKLAERYAQIRSAGGEPPDVAPLSPEEMSAEDRSLLEYPAARRTWLWLAQRYPKVGLTPDTNMELALGVDSLEWLNLTLELGQHAGVELGDEAIGRIETVRSLLQEVIDAAEQSTVLADPVSHPEQVLDAAHRRWLQPRGRVTRTVARMLYLFDKALLHTLFRLQVNGLEQIPRQGPLVIVCNHVSYLDPFAVAAALPLARLNSLYWGGWTGVAFTNPLTRLASFIVRIIPIDPHQGVRSSLALAASVLANEGSLIWFPEGERSESGELLPFRPGIGMLLERFPVTVIPVSIHGTHQAMPLGRRIPHLRRLTVNIGVPLDPRQLAEQGEGERPADRIVTALQEKMRTLQRKGTH